MYLLAIDGGGTKTQARLIDTTTQQQWQAVTGAASLTNDFNASVTHIRQLIRLLCQQAAVSTQQPVAVIGVAGAGNLILKQQLHNILSADLTLFDITTDARIALYGAHLGQAVANVIIGTGSVAMRLNAEGTEKQIGGWGFNIGDEGGGAWLGKQAVRQLLWELDSNEGPVSTLALSLSKQLGTDNSALLSWLKNAGPKDFAAFAPLILSLATRCPQADKLLQQQATEIEKLIACCCDTLPLPVVLSGGLAASVQSRLAPEYQALLQTAKGNALDGAILLAQQLVNQYEMQEPRING